DLRRAPVRDVAHERVERALVADANGRDRDLDGQLGAVRAERDRLDDAAEDRRGALAPSALDRLVPPRPLRRREDDLHEGLPERLGAAAPEDLGRPRVPAEDLAVVAERD